MRFRLLLEVDQELQSATEVLYDRTAGKSARVDALLRYLDKRGMKVLSDIIRVKKAGHDKLTAAIFLAIDSGKELAEKLELIFRNIKIDQIKPNYYENFVKLVHLINNLDIEVNNSTQYLFNHTLYSRRMYDFEYTVRVFAAAASPTLSKKILGIDKVDIKSLYDGNTILPAGIVDEDESENTIHGVLYRLKNATKNPYEKKEKGAKSESKFTVYNSIEKIDKDDHKEGRIVRIEGNYKYTNGKWVPVEE